MLVERDGGADDHIIAQDDFLVNNAQVKKLFLNGPRPDTLSVQWLVPNANLLPPL